MKKTMSLLAGLTVLAATATAQITIAPEAGVNLANEHGKETINGTEYKNNGGIKLGVKAGANVNIPLGDRFVIQPGLFYNIKGIKEGKSQDRDNGFYLASTTLNRTVHYFEIPLNLQYMFNDPNEGRFFIGVGAYMAVAFSGKDIRKGTLKTSIPGLPPVTSTADTTYSLKFGNDAPSNDLRRFDFGAQANVGYLLRSGIFFRAMYQAGISNMLPQGNRTTGDASLRNTNITASIGYTIGYRK